MRNLGVHLGTLCRDYPSLKRTRLTWPSERQQNHTHFAPLLGITVRQAKDTLQRLHRQPGLLCRDREVPHDEHPLSVCSVKSQLYLCLDLLLVGHLGVVHECATARVGWLIARRGILETLDNGRLTTPIVSYNDGDGRKELDD